MLLVNYWIKLKYGIDNKVQVPLVRFIYNKRFEFNGEKFLKILKISVCHGVRRYNPPLPLLPLGVVKDD